MMCHVSMLRRYRSDSTHVLKDPEIEISNNLSYIEEPIEIIGHEIKQLRNIDQIIMEKSCSGRSHMGNRGTYEKQVPSPI